MSDIDRDREAVHVEVVQDLAGLQALQAEWEGLSDQDADCDIFGSFDWFMNWWEHFGHGASEAALVTHRGPELVAVPGGGWQLRVLVARNAAGKALAIVPLVLIDGVFRGIRSRILASPINSHAPRSGIVAQRFDADVVLALSRTIGARSDWDILLLDGLATHGSRPSNLLAGLKVSRLIVGQRSIWPHSRLTFIGTWDQFLASKGSNFRRQLKRSQRALQMLGHVSVDRFRGSDAATRGMELFLEVDKTSWKAIEGECVSSHVRLRDYYVNLCKRLADRGQAEIYLLRVADKAAAAYVCLRSARSLYTLKSSFNEEFARFSHSSPGTLLLGMIVRTGRNDGIEGIDFVCKLSYIDRWASEDLFFEHAAIYRSRWQALRITFLERLDRFTTSARAAAAAVRRRLVQLAGRTAGRGQLRQAMTERRGGTNGDANLEE